MRGLRLAISWTQSCGHSETAWVYARVRGPWYCLERSSPCCSPPTDLCPIVCTPETVWWTSLEIRSSWKLNQKEKEKEKLLCSQITSQESMPWLYKRGAGAGGNWALSSGLFSSAKWGRTQPLMLGRHTEDTMELTKTVETETGNKLRRTSKTEPPAGFCTSRPPQEHAYVKASHLHQVTSSLDSWKTFPELSLESLLLQMKIMPPLLPPENIKHAWLDTYF